MVGYCERCGTAVEKRDKEQWMLAITKYADRLDKDLDNVDYLEKIKIQQRNWIGRSEGALLKFKIKSDLPAEAGKIKDSVLSAERYTLDAIEVFTTRPDTLFGATYLVLAPEHSFVRNKELGIRNYEEVEKYVLEAKNKTEIERTAEDKDPSTGRGQAKTGLELKGVQAINP